MNLRTELAPRQKNGLPLENPVLGAAGTFGYGVEYAKIAEIQRLGAIICNGTSLHARPAGRQPRVLETPSGLLSFGDLPNPGIRTILEKYAPLWAAWQVPVIMNIAGEDAAECAELAAHLEGVPGIAGLELDCAALGAAAQDALFGIAPESVAEAIAAVRRATTLPLLVKLSPGGPLLSNVLAAIEAGADAISLINSVPAMQIDLAARRPLLPALAGGLSGPAIKPLALRLVYEVARELRRAHLDIPLIGSGGISSTEDALQFLMAGASAIQVGSATFVNPRAAIEIVEGIEAFMRAQGIEAIREIVGAAL